MDACCHQTSKVKDNPSTPPAKPAPENHPTIPPCIPLYDFLTKNWLTKNKRKTEALRIREQARKERGLIL